MRKEWEGGREGAAGGGGALCVLWCSGGDRKLCATATYAQSVRGEGEGGAPYAARLSHGNYRRNYILPPTVHTPTPS